MRRVVFFVLISIFYSLSSIVLPRAQPELILPPQEPILRIDPGMHTAAIRRIAVDSTCTLLATGSEDKSVRLWKLPEGKLVDTLRPPIGDGNEGKIYAVAVAPDATWIAAGGWNKTLGDHWVYIFERATGKVSRYGPTGDVIEHLAVSPDGHFLVAAIHGGQGIRVWEKKGEGTDSWKLIARDKFYDGADVYGAAFDKEGVLYTVALNGKLRRYAQGPRQRPLVMPTQSGRKPYSIAIHPTENLLAVGFRDTTAVDVYDTSSLKLVFSNNTQGGKEDNLQAIAWSASGEQLFAGGNFFAGKQSIIRVWGQSGKGVARGISGSSNSILNIIPCGDGIAVAAADPAFGLIGSDGTKSLWQDSVSVDMRGKLREHFTASADGTRIRFGLKEGGGEPVLFDLANRKLIDSPNVPTDLSPADTDSLPNAGWMNGLKPNVNGIEITLEKDERAESLAIASGKQQFVLGADNYLRLFNRDGSDPWRKQVPGTVWGVNIARERPLIIAACADGTIRWYRMDGQELLALFVQSKNRHWVAWTPNGYYMASEGGDNLIGWQINRGWENPADFFPISKFRDKFYRPDIVTRVLADLDENTAVIAANSLIDEQFKDKDHKDEDFKKQLPPVVRIISPAHNPSSISVDEITISFSVRSASGLPIKRVFAQIDGHQVGGDAEAKDLMLDVNQEASGQFKFKIPPEDVTITILAETEYSKPSVPATLKLLRVGSRPPPEKPKLYALIVGVGNYNNTSLRIGAIPGNDADAVAKQFESQKGEGRAFADVTTRVLKDENATKDKIEEGLQWLFDNVKYPDVALMYFSGHGMTIPGYASYLLPVDFDPKISPKTALSKKQILEFLGPIRSNVIFMIDACHAADDAIPINIRSATPLDMNGLLNEDSAPEHGIIVYASSSGIERSYAAPNGAMSYFTQALIDGLDGPAVHADPNTIWTYDLPPWLIPRVQTLSNNKQTPIHFSPPSAKPVALVVLK